ncbi:MAG: FAD binding domain-containing protein [Actinomycetota bacterium]
MKPPPFLYLRPRTLEEAVQALAEHGENAKVLAGGQSLVPLLNFRLARPSVLVDLNLIEGLREIRREDGVLALGAMVRQRTAERSPDVREAAHIVVDALHFVGHVQIRSRGTVGGSIAHADPAAELPAVALATDAEIVVSSVRGRRSIPAAEFFQGPFTTGLTEDEILTEVRIPVMPGAKTAVLELARRSGDFALAGVAIVNRSNGAGLEVSLAAFGVGGTAVRLHDAEAAVRSRDLSDGVVREAAAAASAAVSPFTDVHADADYRRELVGTLVGRALRRVA